MMTRRERLERVINSFSSGQVDSALSSVIAREGKLALLTDAAMEALADQIVSDHRYDGASYHGVLRCPSLGFWARDARAAVARLRERAVARQATWKKGREMIDSVEQTRLSREAGS